MSYTLLHFTWPRYAHTLGLRPVRLPLSIALAALLLALALSTASTLVPSGSRGSIRRSRRHPPWRLMSRTNVWSLREIAELLEAEQPPNEARAQAIGVDDSLTGRAYGRHGCKADH